MNCWPGLGYRLLGPSPQALAGRRGAAGAWGCTRARGRGDPGDTCGRGRERGRGLGPACGWGSPGVGVGAPDASPLPAPLLLGLRRRLAQIGKPCLPLMERAG